MVKEGKKGWLGWREILRRPSAPTLGHLESQLRDIQEKLKVRYDPRLAEREEELYKEIAKRRGG